jgi:hypothetical protein
LDFGEIDGVVEADVAIAAAAEDEICDVGMTFDGVKGRDGKVAFSGVLFFAY